MDPLVASFGVLSLEPEHQTFEKKSRASRPAAYRRRSSIRTCLERRRVRRGDLVGPGALVRPNVLGWTGLCARAGANVRTGNRAQ